MKKMIKLPLFLGATAAICGTVLAVTNYFTKDRIAQGERDRINAAYKLHFESLSYTKTVTIDDSLLSAGVTGKLYAYDSSKAYIGTVYTCSVVGFAGKSNPIKFTVSYAGGQVHHYVPISNGESNQGANFMNWLAGDVDGDRVGDISQDTSGSSVSKKAVVTVPGVVSADYLAEYESIGSYEGE